VLGICRGMQGMNVARGGTLHQHLPDHRQTHAPWAAGFLKRYRDETVFLFPHRSSTAC
jgi:gamma-glutamyl-gamma-aminobutyrate hydrolase PuuD